MSSPKRRGLPGRVKMRHDQHFVEELTSRLGDEPVGRMLPLALIAPDPGQPRNAMGDLGRLAQSVLDKGVLEPILVRAVGPDEAAPRGAQFIIVSGERRYRAAREAGLVEVPAIELHVDQSEALEIALVENLQRKDLTPFEEADGYRTLGEVHGYTHEEIAKVVGRSRSLVTENLQLLKLSPPVRGAAEALSVASRSVLLELVKLGGTDDEQIAILERVAAQEIGRDDLRQEIRRKRNRRMPARRSPKTRHPTFTFDDPEKVYSCSLHFRKSTVDRDDLIAALEAILTQLRAENPPQ